MGLTILCSSKSLAEDNSIITRAMLVDYLDGSFDRTGQYTGENSEEGPQRRASLSQAYPGPRNCVHFIHIVHSFRHKGREEKNRKCQRHLAILQYLYRSGIHESSSQPVWRTGPPSQPMFLIAPEIMMPIALV
jgi:hypothetical protein